MKQGMIELMLYAGCVLMAYNIYRYAHFSRQYCRQDQWKQEQRIFRIPMALLVLFLAGYLSITFFGRPDLVVSGILFGGSIFVFVMLLLIQRAADKIQENEKLEAKVAAAEEASRAKTVFLSNMSHDIRTPLNAIIGYTTLARKADTAPEQKAEYIRKIEIASHQLLDIVNDVLEMSRIESGRIELDPQPANIEDCVQAAADLVRGQLEEKKIVFTVSCETGHPWVLCDQNRLNRALMNLLCNAGKFTEENGLVSLTLRELPGDEDVGNYEIRVKDTGIGMSPDFVEKLFTPFEREHSSTVSRIQGTGLGMAITKNIIDLMGGVIEVDTEPGKGTEFVVSFSLPILKAPEKEERPTEENSLAGSRVLLVEDNEINMEIADMILSQAGILVEKAENGKIALEKLRCSRPGDFDLVLMDVQMPVMDGYTAAKAIRSLEDRSVASVPIIAMTANAFAEDMRAAEEAGMDGHIAKPLNIDVMMQTMTEVLSSRANREE